jgi:uncharacterized protein YbjT (DUF2867 family)
MILVFGATGNVGAELVRLLAEKKEEVRAFARNPQKLPASPSVKPFTGDISDPTKVQTALKGITRVFLLAPPPIPSYPEPVRSIVAAVKKAGVQHIVFLDGLGANLNSPVFSYKQGAHTEWEIQSAALPYTFLRASFFMQNLGQSMAGGIASQNAIYSSAVEGKISMIDTRDIAAVAARVLTENGHESFTYELTGGEALSFGQVAEKLSALLGRTVNHVSLPEPQLYQALRSAGVPDLFVKNFIGMFNLWRYGQGERISGHVEILTGNPPRTLDAYLHENAAAFQLAQAPA